MPHLTIVPVSGLGNRMRVVASLAKAAPQIEGGVRVVWRPAWDCRARFDELFSPIDTDNIIIEAGSFFDAPATKDNLLLPMLLRKFRYQQEMRCYRPTKQSIEELTQIKRNIYIDTCYALGTYSPEDLRRCFQPLPLLQSRIEDVTNKFEKPTVGVHVRRTDNRNAIKYSPLSAFRLRIDQLLDEGKAQTIFLCTDDEQVRDYFKQTYGQRLLTRHIQLNRNKLEGIQDAVVDLWSLSKTDLIVGSYYSSFSDTAAELSGVPLEIIKKEPTSL